MSDTPKKLPLGWVMRIVGSSLVLGVTLWLLPKEEVLNAMRTLPGYIWAGSLVVFLLGHVASAFKWRILIGNSKIPPSTALAAHFAGLVANLCLPGAAGGDVVRAGWVLRNAEDKARVAVGSLADRIIDTTSLFVLASVGGSFAMANQAGVRTTLLRIGLFVAGAIALGLVAALNLHRIPMPAKARALVDKLGGAFNTLKEQPAALLSCFCISLLVQSTFVCINVVLANYSGLDVSTAGWFFAWPLAKLLAVAPVSVGGLGVREASLAALLVPLGAPPARVVAVGLVWQSILIVSGFLGGGILLIGTKLAPRVVARQN